MRGKYRDQHVMQQQLTPGVAELCHEHALFSEL
jgi:hypothetical protein